MWYQLKGESLRIRLRLSPNAKQNTWLEIQGDVRKIAIKAPALAGAANQALIRFLAEYYKMPASAIKLINGHQSRLKSLELVYTKIKYHRDEFLS
jgi:uncharacterized protein (TIGR00251 family)